MYLNNLNRNGGRNNKKRRVGRGYGSTKGGHTVGFGTKGQKSRGRAKMPTGFEGGQVPLYKRIPKFAAFTGAKRKDTKAVSLVRLNLFKDGDKVTPQSLVEKNIIKRVPKYGVKIIANGQLYKKLELENFIYSKSAIELIQTSGSKIVEKE